MINESEIRRVKYSFQFLPSAIFLRTLVLAYLIFYVVCYSIFIYLFYLIYLELLFCDKVSGVFHFKMFIIVKFSHF